MKRNNWYVITGGPCSGKTTTIEILQKLGHKTTKETAREHISLQLKNGFTHDQIRSNQQKLQDEISQLQLKLELSLNPNEHIFLDRAFPDSMGYYDHHKTSIPPFAQKAYKKSSYNTVFYLERISMQTDEVRIESDEEAAKIAEHVYKRYAELKLKIVKVPVMDKQKRVDFILNALGQ